MCVCVCVCVHLRIWHNTARTYLLKTSMVAALACLVASSLQDEIWWKMMKDGQVEQHEQHEQFLAAVTDCVYFRMF
jgi:hypothetical protein